MNSQEEITIIRDLRGIKLERGNVPIETDSCNSKCGVAIRTDNGSGKLKSGQEYVPNSGYVRTDDGYEDNSHVHPEGVLFATHEIADVEDAQFKKEIEARFAGLTVGDDRLLYKDGKRITKQQAKRFRKKLRKIKAQKRKKPEGQIQSPIVSPDPINAVLPNCYICSTYGHFSYECPLNQSHIKAKFDCTQTKEYLVSGTDLQTWDQMWFVNIHYHNHMIGNRALFTNYKSGYGTDSEEFVFIKGTGDVEISFDGINTPVKNVYYVPSLDKNILSLTQLSKQGFKVMFNGDLCHIKLNAGGENSNGSETKRDEYLANYFDAIDLQAQQDPRHEEDYSNHPAISSIGDCINLLNTLQVYNLVYKFNEEFRKAFYELVEWYHNVYLESYFERPIPPYLSDGTKIDLYDLFMMTMLHGGYVEATVNNAWTNISMDVGCDLNMAYEVKATYLLYLEGLEWTHKIIKESNMYTEPGTSPPGFKKRKTSM